MKIYLCVVFTWVFLHIRAEQFIHRDRPDDQVRKPKYGQLTLSSIAKATEEMGMTIKDCSTKNTDVGTLYKFLELQSSSQRIIRKCGIGSRNFVDGTVSDRFGQKNSSLCEPDQSKAPSAVRANQTEQKKKKRGVLDHQIEQDEKEKDVSEHQVVEDQMWRDFSRQQITKKRQKSEASKFLAEQNPIKRGVLEYQIEKNRQKRGVSEYQVEKNRQKRGVSELDMNQGENSEFEQRLVFTCHDRCGEIDVNFPCSCNSVCVLYDTCCENMAQDCPNVVQEGRIRFAPFMNERIGCEKWGVHTILSAPCFPASVHSEMPDFAETIPSREEMSMLIHNAPVTDTTLGLTFASRDIYNCYQNLLNLTSDVLSWGLERRTSKYRPIVVDEIVFSIYRPIFSKTNLSTQWCQRGVKLCDDGQISMSKDERIEEYAVKCKDFTGLVKYGLTFYRNRFCSYCYLGRNATLRLAPMGNPRGHLYRTTIVSESEDGSYVIKVSPSSIEDSPWSELKCPNLDIFFTQETNLGEVNDETAGGKEEDNIDRNSSLTCQATECSSSLFELGSDGVCRASYHFMVSFKDNELGWPPLGCSWAAHQIGEFISCSLELTLNYGPWKNRGHFTVQNASLVMDEETNENFYLVELLFDSAIIGGGSRFGLENLDFLPNFEKLSAAVKAFHSYRTKHRICSSYEDLGDYKEILGLSEIYIYSINEYIDSMIALRGNIVDEENTAHICFSNILPRSKSKTADISLAGCIEDAVYSKDQLLIDQLLASSCVDHLKEKVVDNGIDLAFSRSALIPVLIHFNPLNLDL